MPASRAWARTRLNGGLADAARRHVDDPLEAGVGGRIADQAQERQRVLDLAPLEERHPADDAVVDGVAPELLLQHPRLSMGAVEDGHVAPVAPLFLAQPGDAAGDELGLGPLVAGLLPQHRVAAVAVGPQALAAAIEVVLDDRVGRLQDDRSRPVVLLQLDDLGVGEVAVEVEQVARLGAAPAVDRLVVVADHGQVARVSGQVPHQPVLHQVGVLELVDQDVAETSRQLRPHVGVVGQVEHLEQQVVEVDRVLAGQPLAVARVDLGQDVLAVATVAPPDRILATVLGPVDERAQRPRRHRVVEARLLEQRRQQPLLVVVVEDAEVGAEPDPLAMTAKQARAGRVKGTDPHAEGGFGADRLAQALAHLARRLVGEGHREDLPRRHAQRHQPGDAVDQDTGLAGARPRQNHQRALAVGDGALLLGVEPLDARYRHDSVLTAVSAEVKAPGPKAGRGALARPGRPVDVERCPAV